jgi:hypothetical protein
MFEEPMKVSISARPAVDSEVITYLDVGSVVILHRHGREFRADLDHGIGKQSGNGIVIVEPLDSLLVELQVQAIFVDGAS